MSWPQRHEAQALGCTCGWYGGGAIIPFDRACPILTRHRGVPRELLPEPLDFGFDEVEIEWTGVWQRAREHAPRFMPRRASLASMSAALKKTWTSEALQRQLYSVPLLGATA